MTTNTTDEDRTPAQTLATALRTATAARRSLDVLDNTSAYLAGPMSGYPEFNFPAFRDAARELVDMGLRNLYHTASGVPPREAVAKPWEEYLRNALRLMLTCDAVVALPGWRESKGARLEVYVALELGMPVVEYPDLRPVDSLGDPRTRDEARLAPWVGVLPWNGLAVIPEGAEYGTQTAEYLDRRYGGNDPRRMFEDTIDLPKDEDDAHAPLVVPSDDETEAEYIARRYGGVDPRTGHHIKPEDETR